MRTIFMGSPDFAIPSLRALIEAGYDVVGVFTQPDREAGRGRRLAPPPAKALALEHGIAVFQPERLRRPAAVAQVAALNPELIVVAAYGQILPQSVLDLPAHGCLNVHASLLPRWRGAAPVTAAILAGDRETGVSIMRMEAGLDTGPVLTQRPAPIGDNDTTGTLTTRLAEEGAALLIETLPRYLDGSLTAQPQDDSQATFAPQLKKEDALLDWSLTARELWLRVRAYDPWPIAYTPYQGEPLRIRRARPLSRDAGAPPGTVVALAEADTQAGVATGDGVLALVEVQRAGRRALGAAEFVRGERGFIGTRLG